MSIPTDDPAFKEALKEAVVEALHEQRDWIVTLLADALEEVALDEALREVEAKTPRRRAANGFGPTQGEA